MKKTYKHLCEKDRGVIYRMNKAGNTQSEIAKAIGFSQSTVSKELRRNKGKAKKLALTAVMRKLLCYLNLLTKRHLQEKTSLN